LAWELTELEGARMRIAMIGTRGVPAQYGGFETAVDEIGSRLVARGHDVVVYCRQRTGVESHRGMQRIELRSVKSKSLDTLSHTALSAAHAAYRGKPDMAFVFNAANSPFVPLLRRHGIPVALHTDGLEWKRSKWGRAGRRYYLMAERKAVRHADALISDAQGIADYYRETYGATSNVIAYGAPIVHAPAAPIREIDLVPGSYSLIVARFEPENHVVEGLMGALQAPGNDPVVVVGSSPYAPAYNEVIRTLAASDPRVRLLGAVWEQALLDSLYSHAKVYIHGHSVGGTNPSLLRAMGAGAAIAAFDVSFNREVLGTNSLSWSTPEDLADVLSGLTQPVAERHGIANRMRASAHYRWDDVAEAYEQLAFALTGTTGTHEMAIRTKRRGRSDPRGSDLHAPAQVAR
jgi:glycosyltransferase involved in cell wall biosynthesis